MAVVIDFLSDFEERFWIEPYGEVNEARARSAVEEREELARVLRRERLQKYKESGNTGVFSRGIPKNEVVFPRRPEHFPIQMILRECNALPDFVFYWIRKRWTDGVAQDAGGDRKA